MSFGAAVGLRITRAIRQNNVDEVCRLLKEHANKKADKFYHDISPLLIACSEPEGDIVAKFLIEKANMDVNMICPKCGITPLIMACKNGHTDVVKYLMQHPDIDPSKKIALNTTALEIACFLNPNIEMIKLLLAHEKIDVNVISLDDNDTIGDTPFMIAITRRRFDIADLIINDPRFKVENILKRGKTELHQVIWGYYTDEKLRSDHVKKLIAAGADPTIRQDMRRFHNHKDNCNAIEAARDFGFNEIADYLEKARVKLNQNQYQKLRTKYSGIDQIWQENPDRIYDSVDSLVEYVKEMGGNVPQSL